MGKGSIAAGLSILFWIVYRATATYQYSYDGLVHCLDVEFGNAYTLFLNQNHLIYPVLGRMIFAALAAAGHPVRAILILQNLNAFFAAASVGFFYWLLAGFLDRNKAIVGALTLALGHAFWLEAGDPESYALTALFVCILTGMLLRSKTRALAAGATQGFAILIHQMLFLPAPAFLWIYEQHKNKRREQAVYLAGLLGICAIPFIAAGARFHGGSLHDALVWFLGPAGARPDAGIIQGSWWVGNTFHDLKYSWNGLVYSLIAAEHAPIVVTLAAHALVAAALAGVIWGTLTKGECPRTITALWIWIVVMNAFQFFWAPGTPRFRLLFLPPLIALGLIVCPRLKNKTAAAAIVFLLAIGGVNYAESIGPRSKPQNSRDLLRIAWVSRNVSPKDFFLFAGTGYETIVNVYAAYFAPQIPARSVQGYFFSHAQGDMHELDELIGAASKQGGRVFIETSLWDPEVQRLIEPYGGVDSGTIDAWLKRFKVKDELTGPGGYRIRQITQ